MNVIKRLNDLSRGFLAVLFTLAFFCQVAIAASSGYRTPDPRIIAKADAITAALAAAPCKENRKVLIYGISFGPHRVTIPTAKQVFTLLGENTDAFDPVVSDDLANFEAHRLKEFDAVIFANTTGDVFCRPADKAQFKALSKDEKREQLKNATRLAQNLNDYVSAGGGFMGIHAATDTLKQFPAYTDMIGGVFWQHPWGARETVTIKVEDPGHALIKGVFDKNEFQFNDEIYAFRESFARSKLHVLLSLDLTKSDKPNRPLRRTDGDYPVAWVRSHGKGRVFYCSLGHAMSTFANPSVLAFWLRGIQFATGDLPAETTPGQRQSMQSQDSARVEYDAGIPQMAFAAQELRRAFEETGKKDLQVTLTVQSDASSPEAFSIRRVGGKRIEVTGTDVTGAMYGGLEVADLLRLGLPIKDQEQRPFVKKRGIKINIPLDIRTPAFDDSGEAAQKNIQTMWDFEFWKAYLDDLARYRYNVVSLWAAHPFPNMIKLKAYPDIAVDDVYYSKAALDTTHLDAAVRLDDDTEGALSLGKKISIDAKIKYWQQVFQYAADRGIEIMMVHWNVHMHGAAGQYGITNAQDNPATIKYIRACVREMLLTYPQITGLGVCAGENDDRYLRDEYMTERFVFNAYGKAVMDVKALQPEREIRFIIRRHSTEYEDFTHAFKDYTGGTIDTSVKYAVAHMYSSRRPQEWEKRIVAEGWLEKYKVWLNLRNDDIFMHRWGSPDYAREFIKWIPHEHVAGFYMGSDTYVWGREFISKHPETAGRLEIDKHWYRDRLWGQLAYNNDQDDNYWQAVLKHRFPAVDAKLLLDAWESVSEVIPQLNRSVWSPTDGSFAAEGCRRTSGFLTLDGYHFERPAMALKRIEDAPDPQCITVTDWAKAHLKGQTLPGVAPLQVAENLDGYAQVGLTALPTLRAHMGSNVELKETLSDIESMAYLGHYYADKMRGAAKLALYREGGREQEQYLDQAVAHLEDAVAEWKAYAAVLTPQYKTQIGARANTMDWNATLKDVEKEVETIKEERDYPTVRFVNLTDGARIPEGSDLRVEIEATDGNGAPEVNLRLNGLVLHAENKTGERFIWSGASEDTLKSLKPGMVHLEAVAVDKNGLRTSREINIRVGNASQGRVGDWENKIHKVILNEGETLSTGETRNFPRLECFLTLEKDGSLALNSGTPGHSEGRIWGTNGKANRPKPHPVPFRFYIALADGQLQILREKPGRPKVIIYETKKPDDSGPYKLGITASRRLVVFRMDGNKSKIVWRSPTPD